MSEDAPAPIHGTVDPAFEAVRHAFARNFSPTDDDPGDLGAGLAVIADGRIVVDLWGGWRDRAATEPWEADTLVNAYSVGKAIASITTLALVEAGDLDLDAPVARWWPALAARGKGSITLRQVLAHQAGLPAAGRTLTADDAYDWSAITDALAETEPWWTPGTAHGYHTNTLGHLVGEPAVRVRGQRYGEVVRDVVARPVGADVHLGLRGSDLQRCAEVDTFEGVSAAHLPDPGDDPVARLRHAAYVNPPELSGINVVNTERWRRAEVPSTNPHVTALGVARIMAAAIGAGPSDTPRLLPEPLVAEATTVHSSGPDLVLGRDSTIGLGLMLPQDDRPIGIGAASFGHYGFGGSLAFADTDAGIGFGYVISRPGDRWRVPRTRRLLDALADCL